MENHTEVQLPPELQKQYNDLTIKINDKRKNVMQLEDKIADLFNLPRDNTDRMAISSQMHNATNTIVTIEKDIEKLEKLRNKLTGVIDSTPTNTNDKVSEENTSNYRKQ